MNAIEYLKDKAERVFKDDKDYVVVNVKGKWRVYHDVSFLIPIGDGGMYWETETDLIADGLDNKEFLQFLIDSERTNMRFFASFEDWLTINESELYIEVMESGMYYERDFNEETYCERKYEEYLERLGY